jgi:hypothetical protein
VEEAQRQFEADAAIKHQYANINNAQKEQKITALKNPTLDPHLLNDPSDSLAASYNRWKTVAAGTTSYTPEQRATVAANYHEREIKPFYAALGVEGPSKEEWNKQAYDEHGALGVEVEDFFHSQLTSGILRGLQSTSESMERLAGTTINALGGLMHLTPLGTKDGKGFFQRAQEATQKEDRSDAYYSEGFLKQLGDRSSSLKEVMAHDSKTYQYFADRDEFWQHVNPAKGYTDRVTSGVTELVATLPLFGAIREGNMALGAGIKKLAGENLTSILSATPKGKLVLNALVSGAEGLAYGTLTRPNEEKDQAKWDALSFAAMETVFHIAGQKMSLKDVLAKGGDVEALKTHAEEEERLRMSVEENKHPASPEERRAAYITEHVSNMSQGGVPYQTEIYGKALSHILEDERSGISEDDMHGIKKQALEEDPATASPHYTARAFIQDVLNGRKLTELSQEEKVDLYYQIGQIINDSEAHLNRAKGPIQAANVTHGTPNKKNPSTKVTLEYLKQKIAGELQEKGLQNTVTPEQVDAMAEQQFQEAQAKGASEAERRRNANPISKAKDSAAVRTEEEAKGRKSGQEFKGESKSEITSRSRVPKDAQASHNLRWTQYVEKARGNQTTAQFYDGMAPEDFEKDLEEYFYPKDLRDAGIYFEREHTIEGKQNPNFLAFMYNYKDQMPKEVAAKLSTELEDSLKFEKHFKGYRITEDQKWHFALQMYNHVDMFLGSAAFLVRGEKNVFRSAQSDLLNPTKYQHQLLGEMHDQNMKLLSKMFPGSKEKTAARTAYKILAGELNDIFEQRPTLMSAQKFRSKADALTDFLLEKNKTSSADFDLKPWNF